MALITKIGERVPLHFKRSYEVIYSNISNCRHVSTAEENEKFRVLELFKRSAQRTARRQTRKTVPPVPPRTNVMPVDQDWSNVWPGPRTFHPASVPLPLRQGYTEKGPPPGKFGNAELMKIPNFLHLTPPAIKKHCGALKRFCTPWPENLDETNYHKYFPIEVITSDYCFASPDITEPKARVVTLKIKLSVLNLDAHAKDKLLRLVQERYDSETDILTITVDRCPLRKQNYDYAVFILTALYYESQKIEPWESEKAVADMEYYDWNMNPSRSTIMSLLSWPKEVSQENLELTPVLENYKNAISELMNEGEDIYTLSKYKEATKRLLNLTTDESAHDC